MSERGVFAIDRGWFEHPAFADEPFSEREAWAWLISEAAYKPRERRVGCVSVKLKRGQIAASTRFLAERWRWSKSRVHRFLDRLKNRDMIGTDSGTGVIVITLCNYDKYQRVALPERDTVEPDSGTPAGHQRDTSGTKEKDLKERKEDSVAKATGAFAPADPSQIERELFERGRAVLGKSAGGVIANLLRSKGGNPALARAAIEEASQRNNPMEFVQGAIKHANGKGQNHVREGKSVHAAAEALVGWVRDQGRTAPEEPLLAINRS